ncbi:MAG: hypothetical protein DHS20C18_52720 [Saprospiraceae bacterium]|nr:MAG: hypothetical protein DHS20C18_52720 [Saprospiraceae bacterium]
MKFVPFFLLLFSIGWQTTTAQEFTDPVKYFDYLNNEHAAIVSKNLEYVQYSVHSDDYAEVEGKRIDLIKQLAQAIVKVAALPSFEEDGNMRNEMSEVLKLYLESYEIEFSEINDLKRESKESFETMERYLAAQDAAEKKIADAAERFQEAQRVFAKKHHITLLEGEKNSEIEQINQVNAYYRAIFLKYFKVSKQHSELSDAMQAKEIDRMEKARIKLIQDAQAELKILKLMPDFNGDSGYRVGAIAILDFYKGLAEDGYKKVVEILRKEQLTQEDVDTYNGVIEHYNESVTRLINEYNQALDQLLKNNVPKPSIRTKRI